MPEDRDQAEKQLSTIEWSLRKTKDPSLYSQYAVGFQMLEPTEGEEDILAGIRIFRIPSDLILYGPIFLIDGEAKGEDLLYIHNQDFFVPFTEDWISYLLSKEPFILGEGAEPQEDRPLIFEESSPAENQELGFGSGAVKTASIDEYLAKNVTSCRLMDTDLKEIVKEADTAAKNGLIELMLSNVKVAEYFLNRLDCDINQLRPNDIDIFEVDGKEAQDSIEDLDIQYVDVITTPDPTLTEDEREQLHRERYVVRDNREPDSIATLLDADGLNLVFPSTSGIYTVIMEDDSLKDFLVVSSSGDPSGASLRSYPGGELHLVDLDTKRFRAVPKSKVSAIEYPKNSTPPSWSDMYDSLSPDTIEEGDHYIFVGPRQGSVYGPVRLDGVITGVDSNIQAVVKGPRFDSREVVITNAGSGRITKVSIPAEGEMDGEKTRIVIPGAYKAIRVERADSDGFETMPQSDATERLMSQGEKIEVQKDASLNHYVVKFAGETRKLRLPEAVKKLIEDIGLSKEAAEYLIDQADKSYSVTKLVKEAAMPPGAGGLPIQPPMDPMAMGGMPMDPAMGGGMGGMPMEPPPPPPDANMPTDPQAAQMAELAGQAVMGGQSDLADLAGLSAMMNASESSRFIDNYIGDYLTALDRTGKILFTMYWHWGQFKEDLGEEDLVELEDQLINLFKLLGETVLDLRQAGSSRISRVPFSMEVE